MALQQEDIMHMYGIGQWRANLKQSTSGHVLAVRMIFTVYLPLARVFMVTNASNSYYLWHPSAGLYLLECVRDIGEDQREAYRALLVAACLLWSKVFDEERYQAAYAATFRAVALIEAYLPAVHLDIKLHDMIHLVLVINWFGPLWTNSMFSSESLWGTITRWATNKRFPELTMLCSFTSHELARFAYFSDPEQFAFKPIRNLEDALKVSKNNPRENPVSNPCTNRYSSYLKRWCAELIILPLPTQSRLLNVSHGHEGVVIQALLPKVLLHISGHQTFCWSLSPQSEHHLVLFLANPDFLFIAAGVALSHTCH